MASIVALTTCRVDQLVNPAISGSPVVQPSQVTDSALLGSLADRTAPLSINSSGASALSWTASRADGSPWLVLSASSGTTPATLTLTMNPAGLALGTYRDTVVIEAAGNTGDPTRLPVTFAVTPCRVDTVNIGATITDSLTSADCSAPHFADRFAKLYRFRSPGGDSISVTGTASSFPGALVLDSVLSGSVAPLAQATDCAGASGPPCLRYVLLPHSGYYLIEATSVSAHDTGTFALTVTPPSPPASPDTLAQFGPDSTTAIPAGSSAPDSTLVIAAFVADSNVGDSVRLEADVVYAGAAFTDTVTDSGSFVLAGKTARVLIHGLHDDSSYQWRVRAVDQTGRKSAWVPFGTGGIAFHVAVPQPPDAPTGLAQLKSDGTTIIALGDTTNEQTVLFQATVTDPDPGDSLHLDVEVEPVGTAFTGTPSGSSVPVGNGQTATATVGALASGVAYHWQARVVDETNRASSWVSYGGNAESAADFDVQAGGTQLAFVNQPTGVAAGANIYPAVTVVARTLGGGTDTTFTGTVTMAIASGTGTSGATLGGTLQQAAVKGQATFGDLTIDRTGTGYRLTATTATLTAATSDTFSVVSGQGDTLRAVSSTSVSGTVGGLASPSPTVIVLDAQGNPVSGVSVTFTPGSGSVGASSVKTGADGQATTTWTLGPTAGAQTLSVSAPVPNGNPITFTATAGVGAVSQLVFTQQPTNVTADSAVTPAIQVAAADAYGNVVTTYTGAIGLAIGTNPAGGTLTGGGALTPTNGVATFAGVSIDKAGTGYTLLATSNGLSQTSATFDVNAGPAAALVFTVQPQNTVAGNSIVPAVKVAVEDAQGNIVTSDNTTSVTVAIGTNPGSGTLSGTTSVTVSGGIATFSDLAIDVAANGYTLTASDGSLASATSVPFDIQVGSGNALAFKVEPTSTTVGAAIAPAIQVAIEDGSGNVVTTATDSVTLVLSNNPGGAVLGGTTKVAAVAGVATFDNVTLDATGTGYTLAALGDSVFSATSTSFDVSKATTTTTIVSVTPEPSAAGAPVSVAYSVTSSGGTPTGNVTVSDGAGHTCTNTVAAGSCSITTFTVAGTVSLSASYAGNASFAASTTASTTSHSITAGAPDPNQTTAIVPPGTAGSATTMTVTVRDAYTNKVTGAAGSLAFAVTGANAGATVSAASEQADTTYTASYTPTVADTDTVAVTVNGSGIQGSPFVSAVSVGAPSAAKTTATVPAGTSGSATTITVTVRDASGNKVSGEAANLAFSVSGANGGALASAAAQQADTTYTTSYTPTTAGDDTVTITLSGTQISGSPYASPVSAGAASATHTTAVVPNGTAGAATTITVTVRDANNNKVTGQASNLGFGVSGTNLGAAVSAAAEQADSTYTASYTPTSAGNDTVAITLNSSAISGSPYASVVSSGAATHLVFTQQPSTVTAGVAISPAITVTAEDANNNIDSSYTTGVTLAIGTNAGGGTLSGGGPVTPVNGVATFSAAAIDKIGTGYTLTAASGTLTGATSTAFNVTAAPADSLRAVSSTTLTGTVDGAASPTPTVIVVDSLGNAVSGVKVAFAPSAGTVASDTVTTGSNGQATTTWTLGTTSGTQTLTASAGTLAGSPITFTATAAAGTPDTAQTTAVVPAGTAGSATTVTVTVRDANGNKVTGQASNLGFAVSGANAGAGFTTAVEQSGDTTYTASYTPTAAGDDTVAVTLSGLAIHGSPFVTTVSVGTASAAQTTATVPAGVAGSATTITVTVRDAGGNKVTGAAGTLSFAVTGTNSGATVSAASEQADTTYTASYTPTVSGSDTVAITLSGTAISGSPYESAVSAGAAVPAQTTATVPAGTAGSATTITVMVLDANGNKVTGEAANLAFVVSGTNAGKTVTAAIQQADSTYTASYTPTIAGSDTIAITLSGAAISGSPYASAVTAASATQVVFLQGPTDVAVKTAITPAITVAGEDAYGNVDSTFTKKIGLQIANNPGGAHLGGGGATAATNGIATFSNVTLDQVANGYTLQASSPGLTSDTSGAFNVTAGTASPAQTTASVPAGTAGAATTITVTVLDANGNKVTGEADSLGFTVTGANAGTTVSAAAQQADTTYTATYTPTVTGNDAVAITLSGTAIKGSPYASSVSPGPVNAATSTATVPNDTAGGTTTIVIQAKDANGNNVTTGGDTVIVTVSGANAVTDTAVDNGDGTYTASYTPTAAGTDDIGITLDGGTISGSPYTSTVTAGSAVSLSVTGIADPSTVGTATDVTVTALDQFGNVATGYLGTVHFTSTDLSATLPADYSFLAGDNGTHTFTNGVTFATAGSPTQTVTATDTVTATITGSQTVTVN